MGGAMELIELERIKKRFSRAVNSYEDNAKAQKMICDHLANLIDKMGESSYNKILEVGCGSGCLTKAMLKRLSVGRWVVNDLCETWRDSIENVLASTNHEFLVGDIENISLEHDFDMIVSSSALQWIKDLPKLLEGFSSILADNGILAFNTFMPDNLEEIKTLTGEGLLYPSKEELNKWLTAKFEILHEEEESIQLTFKSPLEVLRHLKQTGVTANSTSIWTRGRQERFCEQYKELFPSKDGGVTLTYRPIYILARKKC